MSQAKDMPVRHVVVAVMLAAGPFVGGASVASADGSGDPTAVKNEGGKYYDKEGNPTFKVQSDETVDWCTYSGFRRYHSDCHVCHGPDGEGSSYAPALSNSRKTTNLSRLCQRRRHGHKNVNTAQESVMPAFGMNSNVMCYLDDIFVYFASAPCGEKATSRSPRGAEADFHRGVSRARVCRRPGLADPTVTSHCWKADRVFPSLSAHSASGRALSRERTLSRACKAVALSCLP